jgi:hypothetical protein
VAVDLRLQREVLAVLDLPHGTWHARVDTADPCTPLVVSFTADDALLTAAPLRHAEADAVIADDAPRVERAFGEVGAWAHVVATTELEVAP